MTTPEQATRRAEIRTRVTRPGTVAAALRPDNTADMETRVGEECVVTTIARETTGGLQSTVDDYVVNLAVATRLLERYGNDAVSPNDTEPRGGTAAQLPSGTETDTGTRTETQDDTENETDIDTDNQTESTHHS